MPRKLTADEVEFSLDVRAETIPYEGNCSAIDPDTDAATAAWIREQLEQGNVWAWCQVRVTASWNGFEGHDFICCCSYESEEDFKAGPYYEDMKAVALEELNEAVARTADLLDALK